MARAPTTAAGALPSSTPSLTTTVILPNGSSSSQPPETLVLRLNRKKKTVSWKEGTVNNEFMQKKSSKKCCIFHKQKPFDEDDSDQDDDPGQCCYTENGRDSSTGGKCCSRMILVNASLDSDVKLMLRKDIVSKGWHSWLKTWTLKVCSPQGPRLNSCSIGGYVIIFSFTHASVDSWTGLCNGAFEAHHHPLAWKTWSTCMEAVWEAGACRKISLRSLLSSLLACCHELSCSMCSRARSRSVG